MKTELIDLSYLRSETFPKEVVDAYAKMVEAEILFEQSKEENAPKPPLERGQKIMFDQFNERNWKCGIIAKTMYAPYSNREKIGAWIIDIVPCKKDYTHFKRTTVNSVRITDRVKIRLVK